MVLLCLCVLPLTEGHFKRLSVHYLSHLIKGMIKHLSMFLRSKWVQTCQTCGMWPASQEFNKHGSPTLRRELNTNLGIWCVLSVVLAAACIPLDWTCFPTVFSSQVHCENPVNKDNTVSIINSPDSMLRQFVVDWVNVEVFLLKESSSHSPSL